MLSFCGPSCGGGDDVSCLAFLQMNLNPTLIKVKIKTSMMMGNETRRKILLVCVSCDDGDGDASFPFFWNENDSLTEKIQSCQSVCCVFDVLEILFHFLIHYRFQ